MRLTGIVDAEQLRLLNEAFDMYCEQNRIERGSPEREEIARFVMALFTNGACTLEELKAALEKRRRR